MKLTDVIKIWDILHVKDTGELFCCDLQDALEEVVGIENNVPGCQYSGNHEPAARIEERKNGLVVSTCQWCRRRIYWSKDKWKAMEREAK